MCWGNIKPNMTIRSVKGETPLRSENQNNLSTALYPYRFEFHLYSSSTV